MVHTLATALVLLLTSLSAGQATPNANLQKKPTPQELIDRWVDEIAEWSAEGRSGLQTRWKGIERKGTPGIINSYVDPRRPGRFLAEISVPDQHFLSKYGSDGRVGWIYDVIGSDSGGVLDREGTIMPPQQMVFYQLMFNPPWMDSIGDHMSKMETLGKTDYHGESCWRIVAMPHGSRHRVDLYFSTENGYWRGCSAKVPDSRNRMIDMSMDINQYGDGSNEVIAAEPGLGYPTQISVHYGTGPVQELEVVKFTPTTAIPAQKFEMPPLIKALVKKQDQRQAKKQQPQTSPASEQQSEETTPTGDAHSQLISMIGPSLVNKSGNSVPSSVLAGKENVLLYFSAKWCPPCRTFTPKLVKFFDQHAAKEDFTVILVSSDKSSSEMAKYMKDYKMNFYAVPYDRINDSSLKRTYGARGIPNLVWLNAKDKPVARSYVNGGYVGPQKVLDTFNQSFASN